MLDQPIYPTLPIYEVAFIVVGAFAIGFLIGVAV